MPLCFLQLMITGQPVHAAESASVITYSVREERPAKVGNIRRDSRLSARYTSSVFESLRFDFYQPGSLYDLFSLDSVSGELLTNSKIDREALCVTRTVGCDVIALDIKVTPYQYFEIIRVRITIEDENDNSPVFPMASVDWIVSESASIGTEFAIPTALDADNGTNGIQSYELVTLSDVFGLRQVNQSYGGLESFLVLVGRLDREKVSSYRLQVDAKDGGNPILRGSLWIYVTVTDTNDNSAVFSREVYEENIDENAPLGTEIVYVRATDLDSGIFGRINYRLAPDTEIIYGHVFAINNRTGLLYLKGDLDREKQNVYYLDIMASDSGIGSLPAYCKVVVHVIDINDNEPNINIITLTESGDARIDENVAEGTFVAHVTVTDDDAGLNGAVSCAVDHHLFSLEKISESEYKLVSATEFDRELVSHYEISITCSDSGNPPQTVTREITVFVDDENDNAPKFALPIYTLMYGEGNMIGAPIIRMNATDDDANENGALTYSIIDLDLGVNFTATIDYVTGVVRAGIVYDYEKQTVYRYLVTATDGGVPSKSASTTLVIELLDLTDTAPIFNELRYTFHVIENNAPNFVIGSVSAKSTSRDNYVVYAIEPATNPGREFSIDAHSGQLRASIKLDRELVSEYKLRVTANHFGYSYITNSADVIIYIDDVNDSKPKFVFPSGNNNTVLVPPVAYVGYTVTPQISAVDPDWNLNGQVVYSLDMSQSDSEVACFFLSEVSGILTVTEDLKTLEGHLIHFEVVARDRGSPYQESRADLYVKVSGEATIVQQYSGSQEQAASLLIGGNLYLLLAVITTLPLALLIVILAWCHSRIRRSSNHKVLVFQRDQSRDSPTPFHSIESRADVNGTRPVTVLLSPDGVRQFSVLDQASSCRAQMDTCEVSA